MRSKKECRYFRNLNLLGAGLSLGTSYVLKKNNYSLLSILPIIVAGAFTLKACEYQDYKNILDKDEKRIEINRQKIKEL